MHMFLPVMMSVVVALVALPSYAHQAPVHEHSRLVPIPPYNPPVNGSGAGPGLKTAEALLKTFRGPMRNVAVFDIDAPERKGWSNLPARFVSRAGVSVGEMTEEQRSLLFNFLSASLGAEGYESVSEAMAAEAFLNGDPGATFLKWSPENYWFAFYGVPSADSPWGWQFGGHHLALNISIDKDEVTSMSPTFVGTEPAHFTYDGVEYNAVVDMHVAGYAIYQALADDQRAVATLLSVPNDVVTGPGRDGAIPPQVGLSAAYMDQSQKNLMLDAIREWVAIQPEKDADRRMTEIESELDHTSFAWIGTTEVNSPSYFRIQGPTLIIELLSTEGNIGQSAKGLGHYHTIYRNPTLEYGQEPRRGG